MNEILGKRIEAAMEIRNVSRKELADALAVKKRTLSKYINGTSVPNLWQVFIIAKTLDVSEDFLTGKTRGIKV